MNVVVFVFNLSVEDLLDNVNAINLCKADIDQLLKVFKTLRKVLQVYELLNFHLGSIFSSVLSTLSLSIGSKRTRLLRH